MDSWNKQSQKGSWKPLLLSLFVFKSYQVNPFVYNRMAKTGGNPQNFNNPVKSSLAPLTFRLEDKQIDAWVRSLPNKSEWLRNAIAAQYERDMAAKGGSDSDSESDT